MRNSMSHPAQLSGSLAKEALANACSPQPTESKIPLKSPDVLVKLRGLEESLEYINRLVSDLEAALNPVLSDDPRTGMEDIIESEGRCLISKQLVAYTHKANFIRFNLERIINSIEV